MSKLQVIEHDNKYYSGGYSKVLFEGNSNTTITLNDNISKFDYLHIYYVSDNNRQIAIYEEGKNCGIIGINFTEDSDTIWLKTAVIEVAGNTLQLKRFKNINIGITNNSFNSNANIYITKVVGYKY